MNTAVKAVEVSGNSKLGEISATYVPQKTCPTSCPLLNAGCYAELGFTRLITSRLNREIKNKTATDLARIEAKEISKLTGRNPLRLHVVGDAKTKTSAKILAKAAEGYTKKFSQPVFTYTHNWKEIPRKNWGKISVLASCHSEKDVKEAHKKGYATAVVLPSFKDKASYELGGIKILPCPSQTSNVTCNDCKLCTKDTFLRKQGLSIGFEQHGNAATLFRIRNNKKLRESFTKLEQSNA